MLVAEHHDLISVKVLITNSFIHLELFENKQGNLFLSSDCHKPEGRVYYAAMPSLLWMFLEDQITLQTLFDNTPSLFVEILAKDKSGLHDRRNMIIELTHGDKTVKQLTNNCPMETWR